MKLLARMTAVVGIAAFSWEAQAADWYYIYGDYLTDSTTPIWASADQTVESPVAKVSRSGMSSGNDYWIVNNFKAGSDKSNNQLRNKISGDWTLPSDTTLNVGSPSTSRFGASAGSLRYLAGNYCTLKVTIRWYNGTIDNSQSHTGPRYLKIDGNLKVEQIDDASTHVLQQNTAAGKENLKPIWVSAPISCDSADS